jgi:methionine synthase I (cobalamin-dependent)
MALKDNGWIGVDLDGTLAQYETWVDAEHIGAPVPAMVGRVKNMLMMGHHVKLMSARASSNGTITRDLEAAKFRVAAHAWMIDHLGIALPVTSEKNFAMIELWDDRAVQVMPNTGLPVNGSVSRVFDLHAEREAARLKDWDGGRGAGW